MATVINFPAIATNRQVLDAELDRLIKKEQRLLEPGIASDLKTRGIKYIDEQLNMLVEKEAAFVAAGTLMNQAG